MKIRYKLLRSDAQAYYEQARTDMPRVELTLLHIGEQWPDMLADRKKQWVIPAFPWSNLVDQEGAGKLWEEIEFTAEEENAGAVIGKGTKAAGVRL